VAKHHNNTTSRDDKMQLRLALVVGFLAVAGCSAGAGKQKDKPDGAPPKLATALEQLLATEQLTDKTSVGRSLTVETATWRWSKASGFVVGSQKALTADHGFRIASATKPFVAAAILRLMEDGKLDISQPIAGHISGETAALLRKGGYDPDAITVQDLMSHTSGIYDYASDTRFVEKVMTNPSYQWTRSEQIALAMTNGKPIGKPGERFSYSDTGYIILGEIVENKTKAKLAPAVRQLLDFDALGLRHTYWEQMEQPPTDLPFSGNALGTIDMTKANHSFDLYGGGGLISTTQDLAHFMRALGQGKVFRKQGTLAILLAIPDADRSKEPKLHGNALENFRIGRWNCIGHGGFWGQIMAYCPEAQLSIGWTVNQGGEKPDRQPLLDQLAEIVGKQ
jgi:D-alanyl-D-alanine carboxypeptidase